MTQFVSLAFDSQDGSIDQFFTLGTHGGQGGKYSIISQYQATPVVSPGNVHISGNESVHNLEQGELCSHLYIATPGTRLSSEQVYGPSSPSA